MLSNVEKRTKVVLSNVEKRTKVMLSHVEKRTKLQIVRASFVLVLLMMTVTVFAERS